MPSTTSTDLGARSLLPDRNQCPLQKSNSANGSSANESFTARSKSPSSLISRLFRSSSPTSSRSGVRQADRSQAYYGPIYGADDGQSTPPNLDICNACDKNLIKENHDLAMRIASCYEMMARQDASHQQQLSNLDLAWQRRHSELTQGLRGELDSREQECQYLRGQNNALVSRDQTQQAQITRLREHEGAWVRYLSAQSRGPGNEPSCAPGGATMSSRCASGHYPPTLPSTAPFGAPMIEMAA